MKANLSGWVIAPALAIGLIWTGFLAWEHIAGKSSIIDRFETVLLDLRIAVTGERKPPAGIAIVAIDDRTVTLDGQYPLSRKRLAELIDNIRESGANALAIDILLLEPTSIEDDRSLARALNRLPVVLASAGQVNEAQVSGNFVPDIAATLSPPASIAGSAIPGLANVVTDSGGTPRHIPQLFMTEDGLRYSFGLQAASLYLEEQPSITGSGLRLGDQLQALDLGWHLALNYYGPEGTIPTLSAVSLMEDTSPQLEGRLVVLGVTATAVGDRFNTPFDPIMPGVEVQATGMANLLDASHLTRDEDTRLLDAAAALLITLTAMLAVAFLPLAPASVIYILLLSGWLAVISILFAQGYWLNGALPFAASLPPVVGLIIIRQVADRYQTRQHLRAQEALSKFQSPLLATRIAEDPAFLSRPKEQEAAILFVDLSGYTGLSERLGAARTRDLLKAFHTIVVDVASDEGGIVLDFMGDGAMLGFGIPDADERAPVNAVNCAFLLEKTITGWLRSSSINSGNGEVRVGAHYGQVVLSRLGHDKQQQITVTGDSVNVASRLLEVGKAELATVVISADLLDAAKAATGVFPAVPRRETVTIRGRQKELDVGLWGREDCAANLGTIN